MTVVDDTKSAVELAVREAVGRQGLSLLAESPKPLKFQDERGSSLTGKRFKFKLIEAHVFFTIIWEQKTPERTRT